MENKKKVYLILGVLVTIAIIAGVSFAYWYNVFIQNDQNAIITDCFKMSFEEDVVSNIKLEKGYPIIDEEGKKLKPYKFSITNICTSTNTYQINMESLESSTMPERVLKVMVNDNAGVLLREDIEVEATVGVRAYKLNTGVIYPNETKEFEVRIWMDESTTMADTDVMNKEFIGKVTITASYSKEPYKDIILNGTDPIINEGLIPVTIDNDGTVKKADISTPWYDYNNKKWANAVILNDESKVYQNNEVIPEDNIESYFVWIPKYRYQLWDLGEYEGLTEVDNSKVHEISIIFGDYNTKDEIDGECTTPMLSGETGNCKVGDYMTHPAFISMKTSGLWVGKFETGYKGSTDTASAQVNTIEPEKIQIKPNVNSWRSIQVANAFYTTYDYKRSLDSHMMKNTEWGAVAYLQHSKYGSQQSVRVNNNSDYVTGYSAVNESTCGYTADNRDCNRYGVEASATKPWNTNIGYLASTTGNISGIYDVAGGSWEYVMGVMLSSDNKTPCSGQNKDNNSGFNGPYCYGSISNLTTGVPFPIDEKYYDIYGYVTSTQKYNRRILGDATGEVGPFVSVTYGSQQRQISSWYDEGAWFVVSYAPWFHRGGGYNDGRDAGLFTFDDTPGRASYNFTFRVVLSPKEGE